MENTVMIFTIITSSLAGVLFFLEIYRVLKNLSIKKISKIFYDIHSNYLKIIPHKNTTEYHSEWFEDKNSKSWWDNNTWINVNHKLLDIHNIIMKLYIFDPTDYYWWRDNKLLSLKNTLKNINILSLLKLSLKYQKINKRIIKINQLLTEREIIMNEEISVDYPHYIWSSNILHMEINKLELIPYWIKDKMNYLISHEVAKKKIILKYNKAKFTNNALWGFAIESNKNDKSESKIIFLFNNKNNIKKVIIYYRKAGLNYHPMYYSNINFKKKFSNESCDENIKNSISKIRQKEKDYKFDDFDWICYSLMILFEFMKKLEIKKEDLKDLIKDHMDKRIGHVLKIITFLENEKQNFT